MIKDGVIVDTSVWIAFFRGIDPHASELSRLLEKDRTLITGIIVAELYQGIKNPKEEEKIGDVLENVNSLEVNNKLWRDAGRLASRLRRTGLSIPLTDIAIAALALGHGVPLYTLDSHFGQIPNLQVYQPGL
jgi:predicted nucleic acid-binding protein